MDSIKLMMEEHQYILRMLAVMRVVCYRLLQEAAIDHEDFDQMIDFISNYADAHHHGKEEKLLFNEMVTHGGAAGYKLVTHGMLVEHDLGRLYIQELREALQRFKSGDDMSRLDIIANAIGYSQLLKRHITKEDSVVYPFARNSLPEEIMDKVNRETVDFENAARDKNTKSHYEQLVTLLEDKYI